MAVPAFVKELITSPGTSNKTAGTTLAATIAATAAGNLIVAAVVFDNAATASKPIVSSISKAAGETAVWVSLGAARSTSTSAGAFASAELWCIRTTIAWASQSITLTVDTSTVMKSINFFEFSGVEATPRSTAGSAYSTTTTAASATTTGTTPQVNDLVLGLTFQSNSVTVPTTDADTTGGSWVLTGSAGSTGGSGTTNNIGALQHKVLTAASQQTLNAAGTVTAGNGSIVAILQAVLDPTITQASYRLYADGTETGSVALAAQDTAYTADLTAGDVNLLVRTRLQSTNAGVLGATDDWQLQYERNASGTWLSVGDALADSFVATVDLTNAMSATVTAWGQSFLGNGQPVTRVGFSMRKGGTPTGNVSVQIYAHSGTFGVDGLPTGSPLATSAGVAATSFPTGTAPMAYFVFDGTFVPANGTPYFVAVTHTTGDASNFVAVGINNAGGHAGTGARLASGAWNVLTGEFPFELYTQPQIVPPFNSANLTDGAATTNRLGAGTGSFVAGKVSEDGLVDDLGWTANNYTELLYAITLKQAGLANADTFRFRILRNGATTGLTYTQTPTVPITKTVAASTGKFKVWTGSAWVEKPVKYWTGSAWVEKPLKVWSGSAWVLA